MTMHTPDWLPKVKRFVFEMAALLLAVFAANLGITWLLGWRSVYGYGQGLVFAGLSVIALGLLSLIGLGRVNGGPAYPYSQGSMPASLYQRAQHGLLNRQEDNALQLLLGVVGALAILLGTVIEAIFPLAAF
jgi:hypothetical protein